MKELKKNFMYQLSDVFDNIKVGDTIVSNGDGSYAEKQYYVLTVVKKKTKDVLCKRADGVSGGGPEGTWLITNDNKDSINVLFLDIDSKAKDVFRDSLKYADVVKLNDGSVLTILQHLIADKFLVSTFPPNPGLSTTNVCLPDVVGYVMTYDYIFCSVSGCDKKSSVFIEGSHYCNNHVRDYGPIVTCKDCGIQLFAENARITRAGGVEHYLCYGCYLARQERSKVIHEYNYKPTPLFLRSSNENNSEFASRLFQGVEQEVEVLARTSPNDDSDAPFDEDEAIVSDGTIKQNIAKKLLKTFNKKEKWFYIKHDGSLRNGFEVVTEPATLKKHKELPWDDVSKFYGKYSCVADSTTTCGLHIHASKTIMPEDHQIRLGYFVNTHKKEMELVARRPACQWAQFKTDGVVERMNKNDTGGKYEALNWNPRETVEFRLFKGTISSDIVLSTLEFVHACILFTKDSTIESLKKHNEAWIAFLNFVNDSDYEYLKNKNILTLRGR